MIDIEVMTDSALKVVCSREELSQTLAVVSRGVSTRTAVLVLSGILLRAEGGRLPLAATDMELSLRGPLEAPGAGGGAVVVSGRTLLEIVRLLPADDVSIEHKPEEG